MALRNIFIVNPKAGKRDATQFVTDAAVRVLSGIPYEIITTEYAGHAGEIAESVCRSGGSARIFACGGDGTLNEVINGIYRGGCPPDVSVGSVPTGSGNDFLKSFDVPRGDYLDFSKQVSGVTRLIDLLDVNGRASINIVSAGYDAAVCDHLESFKRLPLVSGSVAYDMSVIYCLMAYIKNRFELFADGEPVGDGKKDYLFAVAANGRYYGGGFKAAPGASLDDGYIDFIRIPTVSRLQFAKLVGIFRRGEHLEKLPFCKLVRCKTMQICADKPVKVNLDGEITEMKDPVIRIVPRCVNFIIPGNNTNTENSR